MDLPVFRTDGTFIVPTSRAAGPWDRSKLHGSAVAALFAQAIEETKAARPMRVTQLAIQFLRPVPLAPLTLETEIVREGQKIQMVSAVLVADGRLCAQATATKIRTEAVELPAAAPGLPGLSVGGPQDVPTDTPLPSPFRYFRGIGFNTCLDVKFVPTGESGRVAAWIQLIAPLIAGRPVTPLMRAAIAADFANFAGGALDPRARTCINADLAIHVARLPRGTWVLCDSRSWLGPEGLGISLATIADTGGGIGHVQQSLVIEKRAAEAALDPR